jgi:hypothetical protein
VVFLSGGPGGAGRGRGSDSPPPPGDGDFMPMGGPSDPAGGEDDIPF